MNKDLKINRARAALALVLACILYWPTIGRAEPASADRFRQVTEGRTFRFPEDHGAHPDYETEWWYFTGHLFTETGRSFGFELTFFRVGVDPSSRSPSAWAVRSLYLAHFTVTDDHHARFYQDERLSRGAFSEAGAAADRLAVHLGDWRAVGVENEKIRIDATSNEFALALTLTQRKPPVLHGKDGFSRKAEGAGDASYYYSLTRLEGPGRLRIGGEEHHIVRSTVWMDREFTSSKLAQGTVGWDWFALQLDNGEELMVYYLRDEAGGRSRFSSGTLVRRDGEVVRFSADEFKITPLDHWISDRTSIRYPSGWKIEVPRLGYQFHIEPTVKAQEIQSEGSTGVTYWEGRARVKGTPASGNAYVELVGYGPEDTR